MTQESFEFVIYIIHRCADRWYMSPAKAYQKMESVGCVSNYLVPLYDILHTQSADFVAEDVEEYLKKRNVAACDEL